MKRNIIKRLHELGIRYADKQKVGRVKLQHMKTCDLISILAAAEANKKVD